MENNRKTILIASPFFYPELISTGKYNTFLAQRIHEKKQYNVKIICSHPFYPAWQPEFTSKTLDGIEILRGGLNIKYPQKTILRRLYLEFWFCGHFFKQSRAYTGEIDLFIAILPPVFFTFFMNYFFKSARKVVIIHDLLGVMAISSKNSLRKIVALLLKKIESVLIRKFDKVICLSESMREFVVNQYGIKKERCTVHYPFTTLKMGFDSSDILQKKLPKGFTHIVYSGALGEKQRPDEIYKFYTRVCEHKENFWCHIFSRGPIFDRLKNQNNHSRIFFHDLVPENSLYELYLLSDIQLLPQAEGTGAGAFPSKLPNLIAAGVPVLAVCDRDSELEKIIQEAKAGKTVSGWAIGNLLEALDAMLEGMCKERRMNSEAGPERSYLNKFSINHLIDSITNDQFQSSYKARFFDIGRKQ